MELVKKAEDQFGKERAEELASELERLASELDKLRSVPVDVEDVP